MAEKRNATGQAAEGRVEPVRRPAEYRLRIGEVVLALSCPSAAYAASLEEYFGVASSPQAPQARLRLGIDGHEDAPEIPESLFTGKRLEAGRFSVAGGLARGSFRPETGQGTLRVKAVLTEGPLTRVFEQLLYQAFYSARNRAGYDAFLVHSSGVVKDGAGFLFVGSSGSGKSTAARLSRENRVLNDEICLVSFTDDEVLLHGTPFNGTFKDKQEGCASLRAVFLLEKGAEHRLKEVSGTEAVLRLYSQIVPPMGLEEELTVEVRREMVESAERLVGRVPVHRLEFLPDPGFWRRIEEEYAPGGQA